MVLERVIKVSSNSLMQNLTYFFKLIIIIINKNNLTYQIFVLEKNMYKKIALPKTLRWLINCTPPNTKVSKSKHEFEANIYLVGHMP